MKIVEAIEKIVALRVKSSIITGVVKSFNAQNWTCEVEYKGLVLPTRLRAVINSEVSGIRVEPVIGSTVLLGCIDDNLNALVAIQFSEIKLVKIDADKVELNGNQFSIVKAETLQQVMDQNANFINAFKQALTVPVPEPGNGAPSAFQAALNSSLSFLQWGNHNNIQNDTIKHG